MLNKRIKFLGLFILFLAITVTMLACDMGDGPTDEIREDTYTVSGQVVDSEGEGLEGVILHFSEGYGTTETDKEGMWNKTGLEGDVKITPLQEINGEEYVIIPESKDVDGTSEIKFTGYLQNPLAEEVELKTEKPLAFKGGVMIDPGTQDIPKGTKIKVTEVTEHEKILPSYLKPAGRIINFEFSSIKFSEEIIIRIPVDENIDIESSGLYYYDEDKEEWIKQEAELEHGAFIATVSKFSMYGVLSEEIVIKKEKNIPVPYLHQVHASNPKPFNSNGFNGVWACGPTSAVMILAHFNRLPVEGGFSDLGDYIYQGYEAYGNPFYTEVVDSNTAQNETLGEKRGKGAWGAIYVPRSNDNEAGACITRAQNYLEAHNLSVEAIGIGEPKEAQIINALKEDKVIWASVVGHIVVVKGFVEYCNGRVELLINDPWGDPRKNYDKYYDGRLSYYKNKAFLMDEGVNIGLTWDELKIYYSSPRKQNLYGIRNMLIVADEYTPPKPSVDFIVRHTALNLQVGETKQLTVEVNVPTDGYTVDYASNNAEVANVDVNGVVTAAAVGTTSIAVTVDAEGYKHDTKTVPVTVAEDDSAIEYNLTINIEGQGTVDVDPPEDSHNYEEDTAVELKAIPDIDWEFKKWVGDVDDANSAKTTVVMDENKKVTAHFIEKDAGKVIVEFEDANLEEAVRDKINKPDGDIYVSDVNEIIALDLTYMGITSIEGLQYLSNLEELILWGNYITELEPLSNLINLRVLSLGSWEPTRIKDISPLKNLTKLEKLTFGPNMEEVDITPLANLTNLKVLDMWRSNIKDLSPVANLTKLEYLDFSRGGIKDISVLSNLTELKKLIFKSNNVSDISPLSNLTNLVKLDFGGSHLPESGNEVEDISPLKNLTNLRELNFFDNYVSDISYIASLENLEVLDFGKNQVEDISIITDLDKLERLDITANKIKDISPLVENQAFGEDDYIDMRWNKLDLTPNSKSMQNVNTLINRGIEVYYEPQNEEIPW